MSKQCQNCTFWTGNDSSFSANCTQHNQNTVFDFSCPLFSQRAKLKNHNAERGIAHPYYIKKESVDLADVAEAKGLWTISDNDINWTELRGELGLSGRLTNYQKEMIVNSSLWPNKKAQQALEELGIAMIEGIVE